MAQALSQSCPLVWQKGVTLIEEERPWYLTVALKESPSEVKRLRKQLGDWLAATEQVVQQTKTVLGEDVHIAQRVVSMFDTDARR